MGNSINNIKFLGRKFFGVRNLNTTPVYDADAQAYFNANTTITSTADKNAINTFYLGLKSDGIYTKIKAMYLPIWGSAASSKWNLVNPVDSDAAFRLTFSTGWTFSSGGMTPNGTSAYCDTFLAASTSLLQDSIHYSFYSQTNSLSTYRESIGAINSGVYNGFSLSDTNNNINGYGPNSVTQFTQPNSDTRGFYQFIRNNSSQIKIVKTTTINAYANSSTGRTSQTFYIGARNQAGVGAAVYDNKKSSFISFGNGLSDTEATNFYNRVQTLMTYFGINV